MLAVVKHEQEVPGPEVFGQGVNQRPGCLAGDVESRRNAVRNESRVAEGSQVNKPGTVSVLVKDISGYPKSQSRFANPARAGEGQ